MTSTLGAELAQRGVAPDCVQTIELVRDVRCAHSPAMGW
ncbi:hypothetical protein BDK92_5803 [Micromonospora pisi]|uniref:Uncharacterized protein n=1 Tax=Micromonospora pisi TaxID=589240 RepID=A0A495JR01_9ACTN|nr:hypothetical protein BDK92_5803 [Micromonospora pisi]